MLDPSLRAAKYLASAPGAADTRCAGPPGALGAILLFPLMLKFAMDPLRDDGGVRLVLGGPISPRGPPGDEDRPEGPSGEKNWLLLLFITLCAVLSLKK